MLSEPSPSGRRFRPSPHNAHPADVPIDLAETSFFVGRELPVRSLRPGIAIWREKLYAFMTRNAVAAWNYFQIPPKRVIELGTQVED